MRGSRWILPLSVVGTLLAVSSAMAQQAGSFTIDGTVTLADGSPAVGAAVEVSTAPEFGGVKKVKVKKDGTFKVPFLKAGPYRFSAELKGEKLGLPNGLAADASGLWVVTWSGNYFHVTPDGKAEAPVKAPGAELDGIVQTTDGQVLFSSWEKSAVFIGTPDTQFSPVLSDVKAPADIGYDGKRGQVLVPLFTENSVQILKLPATPAAAEAAPAPNATAEAKK